jgi:heavy metal sensor kinase
VARHLSVGAKWALRYAAVTFVTISLFAVYVYNRVERRVLRDAEFIAEIPTRNVIEAVRAHPGDVAQINETVGRQIAIADEDLRLGVQVFDEKGRILLAAGSLEQNPLPLPYRVLSGEAPSHIWSEDLGEDNDYYIVSARAPGGFVQTAIYGRRFARHLDFVLDGFLVALPISLLVTVGLGWLLARGSLRPIQRITATARRISGSNLDAEVPTTGSGDELDQLAVTLNDMMERIREGVERIRRFSADAAHELRTPLAVIRNQIEVTLEKPRDAEEYERVLRQVLDEANQLAEGADAMLRLAQSEAGLDPTSMVAVDLRALLANVVDFFEPLATERDVKLELRAGAEVPPLRGDPGWLHQLFANLVHNALKFTPAGGHVQVALFRDPEADALVATVRDTGIGISAEQREQIFERFHKVDSSRSQGGFGLGLSLAHEITRAHGGEISVESEPGRGSVFRVTLPLHTEDEG